MTLLGSITADSWVADSGLRVYSNAWVTPITLPNNATTVVTLDAWGSAIPYSTVLTVNLVAVVAQTGPSSSGQRVDMSFAGSTPSAGLKSPTSIQEWKGATSGGAMASIPVLAGMLIAANTTPVLKLNCVVLGGGVDVTLYSYQYTFYLTRFTMPEG